MSEQETGRAVVPHYAGVGMTAFGGGGSLPALQSLADVVSIAQLMAKAGIAVRKHLRENPGACLGVTMQALRWEMDPFAVANKTFAVNDQLGYEAQLVAAVVISRAPIAKRPKYTYEGAGEDRQCTVSVSMLDGDVLDYTTPKISKIPTKNSPLWKGDPDQQLGYYAIRSWARRHTPDVILGVYTPEEIEHAEPMRNITPEEPAAPGLMDRLQAAGQGGGFDADHVARETGKTDDTPPEDPKPKAPRKSRAAKPTTQEETPHDPQTGEVIEDAEVEEIEQDPTATDGAQAAAAGPASSASATGAPTASRDQAGSASTAPAAEVITEGYPAADEAYFVTSDPMENDKRQAFRNGLPFSVVGPKAPYRTYEDHAPEVSEQKPQEVAEEEKPTGFLAEIAAMDHWAPTSADDADCIKAAWLRNAKTDEWVNASEDERDEVRIAAWEIIERVKKHGDTVDQGKDATAFTLWAATLGGREGVDALLAMYGYLKQDAAYTKLPEAAKGRLQAMVDARVEGMQL